MGQVLRPRMKASPLPRKVHTSLSSATLRPLVRIHEMVLFRAITLRSRVCRILIWVKSCKLSKRNHNQRHSRFWSSYLWAQTHLNRNPVLIIRHHLRKGHCYWCRKHMSVSPMSPKLCTASTVKSSSANSAAFRTDQLSNLHHIHLTVRERVPNIYPKFRSMLFKALPIS